MAKRRYGEAKNLPGWRTFSRRTAELRHGEAARRRSGKPTGPQDFCGTKRRSGLSHNKAEKPGRGKPLRAYKAEEKEPCPKRRQNGELVTKRRRTCRRLVAFSSPKERRFVAETTWTSGPKRAKLAVPKGKGPGPPAGGPPRPRAAYLPDPSPNDRAQAPAPAQPARPAAPGDSAPVCLLEKALWVPPNDRPFPLGAERKAPKGKSKKGGTPDAPPTPALPTRTPPEDGWEGSQPKRAERRGKPAEFQNGRSDHGNQNHENPRELDLWNLR